MGCRNLVWRVDGVGVRGVYDVVERLYVVFEWVLMSQRTVGRLLSADLGIVSGLSYPLCRADVRDTHLGYRIADYDI